MYNVVWDKSLSKYENKIDVNILSITVMMNIVILKWNSDQNRFLNIHTYFTIKI